MINSFDIKYPLIKIRITETFEKYFYLTLKEKREINFSILNASFAYFSKISINLINKDIIRVYDRFIRLNNDFYSCLFKSMSGVKVI